MAHLEVVWAHENVSNPRSHDADDPLVKVGRLALSQRVLDLGLNKTSQALDLKET